MSLIEAELKKVTEVKRRSKEEPQAFFNRLAAAASELGDDIWDKLSTPAQEWVNAANEAYKGGAVIPDFPDAEEDEDENEEDDESAQEEEDEEDEEDEDASGDDEGTEDDEEKDVRATEEVEEGTKKRGPRRTGNSSGKKVAKKTAKKATKAAAKDKGPKTPSPRRVIKEAIIKALTTKKKISAVPDKDELATKIDSVLTATTVGSMRSDTLDTLKAAIRAGWGPNGDEVEL